MLSIPIIITSSMQSRTLCRELSRRVYACRRPLARACGRCAACVGRSIVTPIRCSAPSLSKRAAGGSALLPLSFLLLLVHLALGVLSACRRTCFASAFAPPTLLQPNLLLSWRRSRPPRSSRRSGRNFRLSSIGSTRRTSTSSSFKVSLFRSSAASRFFKRPSISTPFPAC